MSQEKDIKIAELTQRNQLLNEQIAEMRNVLISADDALAKQELVLIELKTEIITLKSELGYTERRLGRFDKILNKTWYGKLIKTVLRVTRKIKRILLRK